MTDETSVDGTSKETPNARIPGIDKGKIWIADDFDSMSEDELADWYGPNEPAD